MHRLPHRTHEQLFGMSFILLAPVSLCTDSSEKYARRAMLRSWRDATDKAAMDEKVRDWESRTSSTIISTISTGRDFVERFTMSLFE
jgi:hypothetical protein